MGQVQTSAQESRRRIQALAQAYQYSQVLFKACELQAFSYLQAPLTASEFAHALGWPQTSAQLLLDGLMALELVQEEGGRYWNAAAAQECLLPEGKHYLGNWVRHSARNAATWANLDHCLKTGQGYHEGAQPAASSAFKEYMQAMVEVGEQGSKELLPVMKPEHMRTILDIGAGPGCYAQEYLAAAPELEATLVDRPAVLEIAQQRLNAAALSERCTFYPGDGRDMDFHEQFDGAILANVLHAYCPEENRRLLRRIREALKPGGRLYLRDFLLTAARQGPKENLLFGLNLFLHTGGGVYTQAEVQGWLKEAGFSASAKVLQRDRAAVIEAIR